MDKYFTPSIEDIRVGYDYESLQKQQDGTEKWIKQKIIRKYDLEGDWEGWIHYNIVRTPYLTKEQIEAEGWKHNGHLLLADITDDKKLGDENIYGFDKDGFHVVFHNEKRTITFIKETSESFHSTDIRYKGECKDINTFRYICKLLNINGQTNNRQPE